MTNRMFDIFLLRQLNSKRLWKSYIRRYNCRFGYLTYSKGKAKMWHYAASGPMAVIHDLNDIYKEQTLTSLHRRGWLPSIEEAIEWQTEDWEEVKELYQTDGEIYKAWGDVDFAVSVNKGDYNEQ